MCHELQRETVTTGSFLNEQLRKSEMLKRVLSRVLLSCASIAAIAAGDVQAGMISIAGGSYVAVQAQHSSINGVDVLSQELIFDTHANLTAAVDNGSESVAMIDLVDSGSECILDLTTTHVRSGLPYDAAITSLYLDFTPTANVSYKASGFYQSGQATSYTSIFLTLQDNTDLMAPSLFVESHGSFSPQDSVYTLGVVGMDTNNSDGSLMGTLIAGHQYILSGQMIIQALNGVDDDGGDSANGRFTFIIGPPPKVPADPNAVPEPSSLLLCGIGSVVMSLAARRRRSVFSLNR